MSLAPKLYVTVDAMEANPHEIEAAPQPTEVPVPVTKCSRSTMFYTAGFTVLIVIVVVVLAIVLMGHFGPHSGGTAFNLVRPAVIAASPAYFKSSITPQQNLYLQHQQPSYSHLESLPALSADEIVSRFFQPGPAYVYGILADVDSRLRGYNDRGPSPCLNTPPVRYEMHVMDSTVDFYFQCFEEINGGSNWFVLVGKHGNSTYLYSKIGDGIVAAISTPPSDHALLNGTTDSAELSTVRVYYSVGASNVCGSYGVVSIFADKGSVLEFAAAGKGLGYCGAQFKVQENRIYLIGSEDMGEHCSATGEVCLDGTSYHNISTCTTSDRSFSIPPLGRRRSDTWNQYHPSCTGPPISYFGASEYPGGHNNSVNINGTATVDSVYFGPASVSDVQGLHPW